MIISKPRGFPIVGIGASAGGLEAFESLLTGLPREPGKAFVLVPHLAPQFESHLSEILARNINLPVREIKGGDKVEPNQIYVIPPNRSMVIKEGILHLSAAKRDIQRFNPIDSFFRSLADDQKGRAVGVLLSGSGTDGTEGLKAIKARGGTTFAQDDESAGHLSMPHSAVIAGCVDFVFSAAEIGRKLGLTLNGGHRQQFKSSVEKTIDRIVALLRAAKGVDLEFYKRDTIRRRIQRRMGLNRVRDIEKYLRLLKSNPEEVERLYGDVLICVTSFFREPDSFRALKTAIYPRLLKNRSARLPIRIWVPGCSTGEEAYSHAINLIEYLEKNPSQTPFQIFATDVNPEVIAKARIGCYSEKMTAGLSPERLRRFFVKTDAGYTVIPAIRDRCVFAVHDLVQNPPFTGIDLISCRNLLIYLGPSLQDKVMQMFQYALKPRGILMLGRSEGVGEFSGRFSPLDSIKKVFSERTTASKAHLDFVRSNRFLETEATFKSPGIDVRGPRLPTEDSFDLQGQLDGVLPARYTPNGVIVNAELEILRFLGNTSGFLRPAPGKPSMNLRRMASGALLLELRAAIQAAKQSASGVRKEISAFHAGGPPRRARIEVLPIKASAPLKEYFVILFEEISANGEDSGAAGKSRGKQRRRMRELTEDLATSAEHLKAIIEEQESTNARLKASNEDLLSSNEELQSINEEFETSKEELQSSNEELLASTEEVRRGNEILRHANNDLSNLLANSDIAIVLLDSKLAIHRFTPAAEKVLGLSSDEIGRSVETAKLSLRLPNLKDLLLNVIKTGQRHALEAQDLQGRWYYLILRPYRTDKSGGEKSRIEGAVMALIDITARKLSEKNLLRLATVVLDSNDALIIYDLKDRITAWNKGAQKMYGYTKAEALRMNIRRLTPKNMRIRVRELVRVSAAPLVTQRRTKDGRILDVLLTVTVLRDSKGRAVEVATTERDITEQKRAELERKLIEKSVVRLATVVLDSNDAVIVYDLNDRVTAWNKGAQRMYGYGEAEALRMNIRQLTPKNMRIRARELVRVSAAPIETQRLMKGGRILDVLLTVTVLRDDKGQAVEVATTERDITEQKRAERERKLNEKNVMRLATVVLDSNDAVIICDLSGRIAAWNKGAQNMYGYSEAEALRMNISRLMPERDRISTRELLRLSSTPMETRRRAKDGRILDVLRTVTVLRDAKGQPVEIAKTERDITEQMRAERELQWLHARVITAQETERKRLSRELHDGVGQILSGVKFRLESLPGTMALTPGASAKILKVGGFLNHAISEIRRVSQNLMPSELEDLGLEPALHTLCRDFKGRSGVHVTLRSGDVSAAIGPNLALALYRIAQEALNNIGKHSKATTAIVSLSRKGNELELIVSDNGIGFKAGGSRRLHGRGIGLGSMRERAQSVGGSLEIQSKPGSGTTLGVRAPLSGLGEYLV